MLDAHRHTESVLPVLEGRRIGGGFLLHRDEETGSSVYSLAAGFAAGTFAAVFTLLAAAGELGSNLGDRVPLSCLAVFAISLGASVLGAYAGYLRGVWRFRNFGGSDLTVRPWPLRLGDDVGLAFFRARKQRVALERVEAYVECLEWYLTTNSDDNSSWQSHVRRKVRLDDAPLPMTGQPLRFEWTAQLPRNEPASMRVRDSAIEWRFCIVLRADAASSTSSEFTLLVLPQVRT